jgi:NitT/TauT family transport system permease protein
MGADLSVSLLPHYIGLSLLRMTAAYVMSLVFAVAVGRSAARNAVLGRVVPPALDVLQSLPVLAFLPAVLLGMMALLPGRRAGFELASVILIFTGMVWNLTFSFYHSLLTIPRELLEAADMLNLSPWHRLTRVEMPSTIIGLVWNSVISWAGGWFFLMASESFTLGNRAFVLPGLGSYLAAAADQGDTRAILAGLSALLVVIILLDQLVWVPLIVWSGRFKVELADSGESRRSWWLNYLRNASWLDAIRIGPWARVRDRVDAAMMRGSRRRGPIGTVPRVTAQLVVLLGGLVLLWSGIKGCVALASLVAALPGEVWLSIVVGLLVTGSRVALALIITVAWTLPVGVAIGTRPRLARVAQPIVQVAASVPATALFPVLLLLLVRRGGGGLGVASMLLMLLGTQWYVLFNVIAGASALPRDLHEAVQLLRVRGLQKWRSYLIPAIFPFLVTGGLTAQGGAFNASVVSEYVTFAGRTIQTTGLGALIATAAAGSDYSLLAASTLTMAVLVVIVNRALWRPMARLAHERYHL